MFDNQELTRLERLLRRMKMDGWKLAEWDSEVALFTFNSTNTSLHLTLPVPRTAEAYGQLDFLRIAWEETPVGDSLA